MRSQPTKSEATCLHCSKTFIPKRTTAGRFCSQSCSGRSKALPIAEMFWKRVEKTQSCWLWRGVRVPAGYGILNVRHKTIGAHRVSWELHFGAIPEGLHVLHNCPGGDNPSCVNPAHLFLGTQKDNIADMDRKGRRNGRCQHPAARGVKNHQAKLTDALVREIRASTETTRAIARRLGVARNCVRLVRDGVTWKHVV